MKRPEQNRITKLRQLMKEGSIPALLVTRREDVRYLSGFTGTAGNLLVTAGRQILVTDFRYKIQAFLQTKGITILIQTKDIFAAIRNAADRLGVKKIWFDESSLTLEDHKKLKKQGLVLKGHQDIVGTLRRQKDKSEVATIRLAILRAEQSFHELRKHIKPGVTEHELRMRLEQLMRKHGSRKEAFDTIVASGSNGAMPHASTTNRRIKKGELVIFDFGAEADGYYSDITRTICVGRPTARQRAIHEIVLMAQTTAIRSVRPDTSCKSVDHSAREIIRRAGYGKQFGHGTGHGIGLMVHEGPSISRQSKDRIAKDMIFTVEPGVYVPGWGGVRIEDMVLVTDAGAEVLTTLPRELNCLKNL